MFQYRKRYVLLQCAQYSMTISEVYSRFNTVNDKYYLITPFV